MSITGPLKPAVLGGLNAEAAVNNFRELLYCEARYAGIRPDAITISANLNDLDNFASERNSRVSLCDAYDANNFLLGVSRIKDSIDRGKLIIPEDSITFSHLQSITKEDLNNSPEETFYAINALRHVIGSYYRNEPIVRSANRQLIPARDWRVM